MDFYKNILENIQSYIVIKNKSNNIVWYNDKKSITLDNISSIHPFYKLDDKYYDCVTKSILLNDEECILKEYRDVSRYINQIEILNRDNLTGLYTRKIVIGKLKELTLDKNNIFSVVMGDIDYFKSINDEFGHLNGDEVLKYISNVIKKELGTYGIIGRFGGEEFIIVFPNLDSDKTYDLIEKVRNILNNNKIKIDNIYKTITMTFGISSSNGTKDA